MNDVLIETPKGVGKLHNIYVSELGYLMVKIEFDNGTYTGYNLGKHDQSENIFTKEISKDEHFVWKNNYKTCLIKKNFISLSKDYKMTDRKKYLISQDFQMTFTQDSDCCDDKEQYITIKTQNGGGGDFYVIETERWAFDNIPELITILKRFEAAHSLIEQKEL